MNIVETIKNAVAVDTTGNGGSVVSGDPRPESDIPGAFPDSDDEQEVERQNQRRQASPARKRRDSGVDPEAHDLSTTGKHQEVPVSRNLPSSSVQTKEGSTATRIPVHDQNSTQATQGHTRDAEGEDPRSRHSFSNQGPVLSNESLGLSPDKHEIPRGSISHHRETDAGAPGNVDLPARGVKVPEQLETNSAVRDVESAQRSAGTGIPSDEFGHAATADKQTTTTQVRPHHLGNEGAAPPARSPVTGEVKAEEEQFPSRHAAAQEHGDDGRGVEVPSVSGSRGNSLTEGVDSASETLGQYSGSGSGAGLEPEGNGGIRNGVLGRGSSHLGTAASSSPSIGESRAPTTPEAPARGGGKPEAIITGGVHNTVLGHGSDYPYGRGVESPEERRRSSGSSSGKTKAVVNAVISGVSDSGLGLGGVHNGVVGHGSHDEEDSRHHKGSEGS